MNIHAIGRRGIAEIHPRVTEFAPEFTAAVNVTTVPALTELTAVPPDVTAMEVVVAASDCATASAPQKNSQSQERGSQHP